MNSKSVLRMLILLVVACSLLGVSQPAFAQPAADVEVVVRDLTYWNGTFSGSVNEARYEKWAFSFTEQHTFTVTATTTWGNLVPLVTLLDASDTPLVSQVGSFTSTQPAGDYFILVQPQSGSGNYELTIRESGTPSDGTSVSVAVNPSSVTVGETALVTVSLNNVPGSGLTSAEFTCTYDASLIEVSAITDAGLFGSDAAVALNGPASGMFIFAIAGSNGRKATADGVVFTFNARGLQIGEVTITCQARVSIGDQTLTELSPASQTLSVVAQQGTLAGTVHAYKPVTVSLYAGSTLVASVTANQDGAFSLQAPAGAYTAVASAQGYLDAQGAATLTSGSMTTMPTITLPAGDIDGNDVIDQFDAMTIGMNYNGSTPAAADLNNDGIINVLDLELLAANYRLSGALAWQ